MGYVEGGGYRPPQRKEAAFESSGSPDERLHRAREYWIDKMAFEHFRIPLENIQHPTIRHYVGLLNDTYALWDNADKAVNENEEARMYRAAGSWERLVQAGKGQPLPPGMHASYPMRLVHTRELAAEANGCLEYGFGGFPSRGYLDDAVRLYGCAARSTERTAAPLVTPGSLWQQREGVEETRKFIPSGEPPPQNYLWRDHARAQPIPHFEEIAKRLGIPQAHWHVPEIRRYISLISDSEALLHEFAAGERPPGTPGLNPSVTDRYRAAVGIVQFTLAMLHEGFAGRTVEPDFVQETLAPLTPFGIEVVKIPPGQKLLP